MQVDLKMKINAMLWDLPGNQRIEITGKILSDPFEIFQQDEQLLIKALSSLKWYDLLNLLGKQNLHTLLTDSTIKKLFPLKRRTYYSNAKRLLSKYCLPTAG
jgi:hypothetical protein